MFKDKLSCMSVTKDFGEMGDRMSLEMLPCLQNPVLVCIGEDGVASFYDFNPFGLGTKDNAGLLEEIGFFLHAARVRQYQRCVSF